MKRVIDVCCGSRMFWSNKANNDVVFGDIRKHDEILCDGRRLSVNPDLIMDFRNIPLVDESFDLVVFDPPHLHTAGEKSWLAAKYGKLNKETWRDDIAKGFSECFRVLSKNGTLIFKWNESQIKIGDVIKLSPIEPLFGHVSGRKGLTHWLVFMKPK